MEKKYTIKEAAEILNVSEAKIKRLIVAGKIVASNVSLGNERKHFRISAENLEAFMKSNEIS
jgi:excisionase family DNA binding protein